MSPPYVIWSSVRHQDGRRNSGVGYNLSMVHIRGYREHHALCGREVMIPRRLRPEDLAERKHCGRCRALWTFVLRVAEAARTMHRSGDIAEHLSVDETRVSEALSYIERSYAVRSAQQSSETKQPRYLR